MSDKKHIDRLFQEKLKDFEVTPDKSVWKFIETDLNKKKKDRKVIPLWWKLSGVAAGLVLLLALGNYLFSDTSNSSIETIVEAPDENFNSTKNLKTASEKEKTKLLQSKELITNSTQSTIQSKEFIVNNSTTNQKNIARKNFKITSVKANSSNRINSSQSSNASITNQKISSEENLISEEKSNQLIENTNKNSAEIVAQTSSRDLLKDNKKEESIEDAIANADENKEVEEIIKEPLKRWSISPNIAPVYFNSLGEGSSIHSQFNNNSKSGSINMSYGVNASYAVNNKIQVRTGINKVNLGYTTNDVIVYNNISTVSNLENSIRTISFNPKSSNLSLLSASPVYFQDLSGSLTKKSTGKLDQEFGFIEIPVELEYILLDNKFGMSVIGGVSTLFLNNNDVFSVLDGAKTLIGEATNINKTSFSANFGFGLNYEITKKINLNIEPTFKYQLNTFSDTSGDFEPYFIGIYSGVKYQF